MRGAWLVRATAFGALGVSFFLSGCLMPGESDSLKMSIAQLQMRSDEQRKEVADLKARIDQLSQDTGTILGALKENQSSVLSKTYDFSKELQALKGQLEENRFANDKASKEMIAEREVLNVKIAALENEVLRNGKTKNGSGAEKKVAAVGEAPIVPAPAAVKAVPEKTAEVSPQKLYDGAMDDFKEKRYAEARTKFDRFVKTYPKHSLYVSARYWLGESYFGEKKFNDAIVEFDDIWQKSPKHEKARSAMLKEGYAFYETKDCRAARVILQKLIEKYPQSEEAKLAEKKMSEIAADKKNCTVPKTKKSKKKTAKKKSAN
ncbi:MAG TPA: tol-pal system protein YbgF [Dissulfurispiraceae bacterium]|nr:tol-pal system protein YbgF [Dissulfurispiraceae bacterium]